MEMTSDRNIGATDRRSRGVWVPLALILGAATAGVGTALDWLSVSGGTIGIPGGSVPGTLKGYEFPFGIAALVAAGVALFLGLLWLALVRAGPFVAALSVLAGGVIVAVSVYVLIDPTARFVEAAAKLVGNAETTTSDLLDLLPRFFGANDVTVAFEIGLWLALAGGSLVALAGMLGIAAARRMAR
jgi:hypothetical protein